jgi:hypothetical protein
MSSDSPAAYVPSAVVAYQGPTDRRGSRWVATITRGQGSVNRFRVAVPYEQGPDAAAAAVVARFNECMGAEWRVTGPALSLDGGTRYAYPCGVQVGVSDSHALDAVAALLSAEQWSSDHLCAVADMVRETGRTISEPV